MRLPLTLASSSESRRNTLQILVVFCVPVLLYLHTLTFGFTNFDDANLIITNAAFLGDFGNAPRVFLTDAFLNKTTTFYRPLQTLTYMIDVRLAGGISAAAFHLTNLLLLGCIACTLLQVLKKFLVPATLAVLATLLYCLHPLFVSSVVWIPARGDLLLTCCALLSFLFLINFLQTASRPYLILHWITFTMALLCKETAALLPALFIAYHFMFSGQKPVKPRYPLTIASYVVTGLFWYALRSKAISSLPGENALFGVRAIIANIRTIPEALASFFLPVNLAPLPYFSTLKTVLGSGIIIIIAALFARNKIKDYKTGLFGLIWFIALMAPPLLFKHHLIDYLPHRFFLPLIGILLFICSAIPKRWLEQRARQIALIVLPIMAVLSNGTFTASRAYREPLTFYDAALAANPNSALAYNNRGIQKGIGNDVQGALADFNRAIQLNPAYEEAYNNRGLARLQSGDHLGAITDFDRAIAINSSYPDPHYYRGLAYYNGQDYRRAIGDFSSYTSLSKVHRDEYNYLGKAEAQLGNYQEAAKQFSRAVAINPKQQLAYVNRAIVRSYLGDYAGVVADCDSALALQADNKDVVRLRTEAMARLQGRAGQN